MCDCVLRSFACEPDAKCGRPSDVNFANLRAGSSIHANEFGYGCLLSVRGPVPMTIIWLIASLFKVKYDLNFGWTGKVLLLDHSFDC